MSAADFWKNVSEQAAFSGYGSLEFCSGVSRGKEYVVSCMERSEYPDSLTALEIARKLNVTVEFLFTSDRAEIIPKQILSCGDFIRLVKLVRKMQKCSVYTVGSKRNELKELEKRLDCSIAAHDEKVSCGKNQLELKV